ncbi:hypothetical protein ACPEEZ_07675 [Frigoribacterium sp. 2-23]|uniref:hypothetical protein n=1 Tax=Frigoribacterium sp. 2-23 TaxID=3415006 RepID=UPI003C6FAC2A
MPSLLPSLLTSDDLPEPELRAALLDGEVYELGDCYSSIADLDLPWRRASSLRSALGQQLIGYRATAAWCWGFGGPAPARLEGCVSLRARGRSMPGRVAVSEVLIDDDESVALGEVRVTSPARTMADIARLSDWNDADRAAVLYLASEYGVGLDRADALLWRRARLRHRVRAEHRLTDLLQPARVP